MTGNEAEDGKKDDGYDLEYYERTVGKEIDELKQQVEDMRREVGNVAHQVNTASKFSMVSSVCLLILVVIIMVLLCVGVAMIVKTKSNSNDENTKCNSNVTEAEERPNSITQFTQSQTSGPKGQIIDINEVSN